MLWKPRYMKLKVYGAARRYCFRRVLAHMIYDANDLKTNYDGGSGFDHQS